MTIARLVISIVIDSINRMLSRRPFAHISEKIGERLPSRANPNTSPTIVFIVFLRRVTASSEHRCPNAIFRRATANHPRLAVFSVSIAGFPSCSEAAATPCISSDQTFTNDRQLGPAIADTCPPCSFPYGLMRVLLYQFYNQQASKLLIPQVPHRPVFKLAGPTAKLSCWEGSPEHALAF